MSENSKIEWTDHTFNPWEGCQKVGPGCDHCYAETRNARFGGGIAVNWGPGAPRRRTSDANWNKPYRWDDQHEAFFAEHGRRQRVFCASLADVFDNAVDPDWRTDLFFLIQQTPHLDWLLLTKRIGNVAGMVELVEADLRKVSAPLGWPLPNVWLGATIVNQEEADRDIPKLMATPARVRFLSMEPLLGPVNLRDLPLTGHHKALGFHPNSGNRFDSLHPMGSINRPNWVIVGGESGPSARPMHPDWARSLRDQCATAGVPFLFKQWGEWWPISEMDDDDCNALYRSRVKARAHEDQEAVDDCWGRKCIVASGMVHLDGSLHGIATPMSCLQGTGAMQTFKVGKKAAGRLLDGIEHNGFPS